MVFTFKGFTPKEKVKSGMETLVSAVGAIFSPGFMSFTKAVNPTGLLFTLPLSKGENGD